MSDLNSKLYTDNLFVMKNSEMQPELSYVKKSESIMLSFSMIENYYSQDNEYYKNNSYENSTA